MMQVGLRALLFCAVVSSLLGGTVAYSQDAQAPQCSPGMLDFRVVTSLESANESAGHLVAIEIENRSQTTCWLNQLITKFPPDDHEQYAYPFAPDSSQAALAFKEKSHKLGAGEVAHFLLAWSSVPLQIKGLVMNNCAVHDDVTLSYSVYDKRPVLELRHLWMQTCGEFWRSSYRFGAYVPGESIAKEWLERMQLKASDFPTIQNPVVIGAVRPALTLRSPYDVEYLQGSFESGYSGDFELFLNLTSPVFSNCPFHSLRKREADGQTIVYLNHCNDRRSQPEAPNSTTASRLLIRELGLLPQRAGHVDYEVVSEVLQHGALAFARAQAELSVRDPSQPMLPAIDTSTPACEAFQLKLTTPPLELGSHWRESRAYAAAGEEWYDAKVFEVENISGQNCVLGGVPELKFLNAPEVISGFLRLPLCRNCATSLFKPRESRWIELRPNEFAHFMVARTVFDPAYWYMCTVIGGLELTLPDKKEPIPLPFEAGTCGRVSVSAWRAGRYDADPMNIHYDEHERQREQHRLAAAPPLPGECERDVSPDTGRPVIFPSHGPVMWGLSTKPSVYGQGTPVLLWLHNPTDKPQPVWTCQDIDRFWLEDIDVFDFAGQRVLSVGEKTEKKLLESGKNTSSMLVCTRNFPIDIPSHTCVHGIFSKPAYDLVRDLQTYYSLPPGRYFIVPRERNEQGHRPAMRTGADPPIGVAVTVLQE